MQTVARWLLVAAVGGCCVAMMWTAQTGKASRAQAKDRAGIWVTRVYSGADGESHAEDVEGRLGPADKLGLEQSEIVKAVSTNFARFPADFLEDWHCAHARRYVITLSGRGEAEIGGEKKIAMEPGRVVLFEDFTGKGHISRALTADWTAVFVQLE